MRNEEFKGLIDAIFENLIVVLDTSPSANMTVGDIVNSAVDLLEIDCWDVDDTTKRFTETELFFNLVYRMLLGILVDPDRTPIG